MCAMSLFALNVCATLSVWLRKGGKRRGFNCRVWLRRDAWSGEGGCTREGGFVVPQAADPAKPKKGTKAKVSKQAVDAKEEGHRVLNACGGSALLEFFVAIERWPELGTMHPSGGGPPQVLSGMEFVYMACLSTKHVQPYALAAIREVRAQRHAAVSGPLRRPSVVPPCRLCIVPPPQLLPRVHAHTRRSAKYGLRLLWRSGRSSGHADVARPKETVGGDRGRGRDWAHG